MSITECQGCQQKSFLFCCFKDSRGPSKNLCHACLLRAPVNRGVRCGGCQRDISAEIVELRAALAREENGWIEGQAFYQGKGQNNVPKFEEYLPPNYYGLNVNLRNNDLRMPPSFQNRGIQANFGAQNVFFSKAQQNTGQSGRQSHNQQAHSMRYSAEELLKLNEAAELPVASRARMNYQRQVAGQHREVFRDPNRENHENELSWSETSTYRDLQL